MFDSGISKLVIHHLVVTCWNWLHPACAIAASSPIRPSARTMSSWPAPIPGRFDILTSWCPLVSNNTSNNEKYMKAASNWEMYLALTGSLYITIRGQWEEHHFQPCETIFDIFCSAKKWPESGPFSAWFLLFSRSSSKNIQSKPQSTYSALVSTTFRHLPQHPNIS